MQYYAGIDLHSNNSVIAIIDNEGKKMYQKRLDNNLDIIQKAIEPYKPNWVHGHDNGMDPPLLNGFLKSQNGDKSTI